MMSTSQQGTDMQAMPKKLTNLMSCAMRISIADLVVKTLFVLYNPEMHALVTCLVLSIPSCLALYGICFEEVGNKPKWVLPALIHYLVVYGFIFVYAFGLYLCAYIAKQTDHMVYWPQFDIYHKTVTILLFWGVLIGVLVYHCVQMLRLFLYKPQNTLLGANGGTGQQYGSLINE